MSWEDKFLEDVEKMFQIPREQLRKFVEYMATNPDKVQQWAETVGISEMDFLMLTTVYTLYKTEEKVLNLLTDLEVKVDEAVGLISTLVASLLNSLPDEDRRPILAQVLLATALQVEDAAIRNSLAEYAKAILTG